MEVVIYGAGSLGSLLGGVLERVHDVTLVGRDPHVSAVRDTGLRVTGLGEFETSPGATTDGTGLSADLAVVTVKAYDTELAARELATGEFETVVSLQNGMGNEETLAATLPCTVLAGTTTYGALLSEPGVVEWTGRGDVVVGPWEADAMEPAERIAGAFREADVDAAVDAAMRRRLWEKLAVNTAINPVTALARVRNGRVFEGPTAGCARVAASETARVARTHGIGLDDEGAVDRAREVAEATSHNRSSMLQDVLAGQRTEIDALCGFVVSRAEESDVSVPVNRTLWGLVRGWERKDRVR